MTDQALESAQSPEPDQSMFETVLASTVHDMKNSLSLLLSQLDNISDSLERETDNQLAVNDLRYQASRINISLMELLTLYKLDKKQVGIQFNEVIVVDFIADCIAAYSLLAENKDIQLDMQCDDALIWFFDPDMVGIAINNIIGNCIRYTKSKVLVSAELYNGQLSIRIDDDGQGYPENMIDEPEQLMKKINFNTGSTGLGLYFAATIAQRHQRQHRCGNIQIDNDSPIGGGCFQINLP